MISVALGTRETTRTPSSLEGSVAAARYLPRTMSNVRGMRKKLLCAIAAALVTAARRRRLRRPARHPARMAPSRCAAPTSSIRSATATSCAARSSRPARCPTRRVRSTPRRSRGVRRDAQLLKSMGVNTVRLDVSAIANSNERLAAIRHAVRDARKANLVVILSVHGGNEAQSLAFVGYLAAKFHKDRSVWLQPAFDPSCDGAEADRNRCISWSAWRAEQRALVHAIRKRRHALADPALDAAPLGRPAPAGALPPDRQGPRLRRALPRRPAHEAQRRQPEAARQALRRARARASSRSSSTTSAASPRAGVSTSPAGATTSRPS